MVTRPALILDECVTSDALPGGDKYPPVELVGSHHNGDLVSQQVVGAVLDVVRVGVG